MKKFMEPAIEVEIFAVMDVVTTSGDEGGNENELPEF